MTDYIELIKKIVEEGISNGEFKNIDAKVCATDIFCTMYTAMAYGVNYGKLEYNNISEVSDKFYNLIINGIK